MIPQSRPLIEVLAVATAVIRRSPSGGGIMGTTLSGREALRIARSVLPHPIRSCAGWIGSASKPSSGLGQRGSWGRLLTLQGMRTPSPSMARRGFLPVPYSQNIQTASFSRPERTLLLSAVPPPPHQPDTALTIKRPVSSRISLQRSPTVVYLQRMDNSSAPKNR